MTLDALIGTYAWVNRVEGITVAVMRRRPVEEVLAIYGRGGAEPVGDAVFEDMDAHRGPDLDRLELFVQVLTLPAHTVTLEHNGYSGAFPEIARRCSSDGGSFFSVYWNVDAAGMITQAVDGAIVASFESLYPLGPDEQPWERRPAWAIGPEVEPALVRQVGMALLEQQTGVAVEREWLARPHPAYRIPEPYALYRDVEGADRI